MSAVFHFALQLRVYYLFLRNQSFPSKHHQTLKREEDTFQYSSLEPIIFKHSIYYRTPRYPQIMVYGLALKIKIAVLYLRETVQGQYDSDKEYLPRECAVWIHNKQVTVHRQKHIKEFIVKIQLYFRMVLQD